MTLRNTSVKIITINTATRICPNAGLGKSLVMNELDDGVDKAKSRLSSFLSLR